MKITDLVRFTILLLRRGTLRKKGYDFTEERNRILREFPGIVEPGRHPPPIKRNLMKIPFLSSLIAEAAFIRRSMRRTGGHLTSSDGKIGYVRIPKAASTAACKAILQNRFPNLETDTMTPGQINAIADSCLETESWKPEGKEMFTIVRNPFARIVSVYRTFFEEASEPFLYQDYLMGIFRRDISFSQFVEIAETIPDQLRDQHLMSQDRLLRYYDERGIAVHIFHLEQIAAAAPYLAARRLKVDVVHKSPRGYDYRSYYDHTTLERVAAMYRRDISRFGYEAIHDEIKSVIEQRDVQI